MKTIEINNKHYQEIDVIMLNTTNESPFGLYNNKLYNSEFGSKADYWKSQHLYFLNDEEIKDDKTKLNTTDYYYVKNHYNEWYIGKYNGSSFDFINHQGNFYSNLFTCKKVIATTDISLKKKEQCPVRTEGVSYINFLSPQIPQSFIRQYIQNFNNGNTIDKVLVEIEEIFTQNNEQYIHSSGAIANYSTHLKKFRINDKNEVITLIQ